VRLEGLDKQKNVMTSPGLRLVTFWLVARVPQPTMLACTPSEEGDNKTKSSMFFVITTFDDMGLKVLKRYESQCAMCLWH
jgi:hypothetical protein